jgi:hypothetical protein
MEHAFGLTTPLQSGLEAMRYYQVKSREFREKLDKVQFGTKLYRQIKAELAYWDALESNARKDTIGYMHPKLQSLDVGNKAGQPFVLKLAHGDENL